MVDPKLDQRVTTVYSFRKYYIRLNQMQRKSIQGSENRTGFVTKLKFVFMFLTVNQLALFLKEKKNIIEKVFVVRKCDTMKIKKKE